MTTNNKKFTITPFHLCMVAFAICINFVGAQIALVLRLPIFLDSIGTFFIAMVLGPVYGMLPSLLSGLVTGLTTDIYSLYYAPVGILLGLVTGLVFKKYKPKKWYILLAALIITIPTTIVSSLITAGLFGGITSSGNTYIIQLLSKTPLGMVGSCFVVQFFMDYIDRVISIVAVTILMKALPGSILGRFKK